MTTNIIIKLIGFNRLSKQLIMILLDSIAVVFILIVSISIRLDYLYWPSEDVSLLVFGAPLIAIPIFVSFGLYKSVIRHIGLNGFLTIIKAVSLYSVSWGLLDYLFIIEGIDNADGLPRSIFFINFLICILVIVWSRLFAQKILNYEYLPNIKNIIIYGAGSAGIQLSNALKMSKEFNHVYYLDDNESLKGTLLNGIKVANSSKILSLIKKYNIKEILLALPSCSRKEREAIIERLSNLPVSIRSLPSVSEITEGKVKIDDLLEIKIEDLLGRNQIRPSIELLKVKITTKVVLVTGAGGSIGSELCRQIVLLKPKILIMFDISEPSLYQIQQELSVNIGVHTEIIALLGSVRSINRIKEICNKFKVQTIYHAAAYKHVPLVEFNQSEAVLNNIMGTINVAKAAIEANVETFVLISTDKAVRPTNTMGATKRVAEMVLQALNKKTHNTCFTMVRFGNVLDSSGSVVPLFKKQIKEGGPITVTDANVVRYFMTISEAVELVIQAGAMGQGGDVFVLDMGKPVLIYDLAVKMIHLSGLKPIDANNPKGDIEIIYTGLRPGEKLYEELLVGDNVFKTKNKLILRAEEKMYEWIKLEPLLLALEKESINADSHKIRELLVTIVPEFKPIYPIIKV